MSVATQQKHPSLADIVRDVTDDGRLIVEFYLGVANGRIHGFRDHHRAAAARRIDKIAPGLVAEYLVKYAPTHLRDSYRGIRAMGSISPINKEKPEHAPRGPNPFQRRLHKIVRQETNDGRAIVHFLCGVMHGTLLGFKPHHRLEAAHELANHITNTPVIPASPSVIPAEAGTQQGGAARGSSTPSPSTKEGWEPALSLSKGEGDSPVNPAKSETQSRGAAQGSLPTTVRPEPVLSPVEGPVEGAPSQSSQSPNHANQSPHTPQKSKKSPSSPSAPSAVNPPIPLEELEHANFQPHHLDLYNFARDEITGAIYAFDQTGPIVIDEDGEPHRIPADRIVGYPRAVQAAQARPRADRAAQARPRDDHPAPNRNTRRSKTRARRAGNAGPRPSARPAGAYPRTTPTTSGPARASPTPSPPPASPPTPSPPTPSPPTATSPPAAPHPHSAEGPSQCRRRVAPTPSPLTGEGGACPELVEGVRVMPSIVVPAAAGTQGRGWAGLYPLSLDGRGLG